MALTHRESFSGFPYPCARNQAPLQRFIYLIPHPMNIFSRAHFALTMGQKETIGSTGFPILKGEPHGVTHCWCLPDAQSTIASVFSMVRVNVHDLPALIKSEWPKIFKRILVREPANLVPLRPMLEVGFDSSVV
jgi:hypothetical protein